MKKNFLIFISFLLIHICLISQVNQDWVTRYIGSGSGYDIANNIILDSYNNIYVTGYSKGSGTDDDIVTIKYSPAGIQQWIQRFNGTGDSTDQAYAIAIDNNGNIYITGSSLGIGSSKDIITIKYNSDGVQQWTQRYNGSADTLDCGNSIITDNSGNVYITGTTFDADYDIIVIKYNTSGIQQWIRKYSGAGNDFDNSYGITIDANENIYITGMSYINPTQGDIITIKYNSSGVQQWVSTYSGPGNDNDCALLIAIDNNNVIVSGYSLDINSYPDFITVKYNSFGVQQWVQRYNNPSNLADMIASMKVDNNGNIIVTGISSLNTYSDYLTIKYNSLGVQQWMQRYNGPQNNEDRPFSLSLDQNGNIYVTGYSVNVLNKDITTIKYDVYGNQKWIQRYSALTSGGWNEARAITVDQNYNVYVTGGTILNDIDYTTIKYSQPIGIKSISNELPDAFELYQNYPNPFNPNTILRFALSEGREQKTAVRLIVYNSIGQEIETLVNSALQSGEYEITFDASRYSGGLYFYSLFADGKLIDTKKMMLVK